jgi:hypothetical protein
MEVAEPRIVWIFELEYEVNVMEVDLYVGVILGSPKDPKILGSESNDEVCLG